ncbi:MAG TPA: ABC transporter ATP-binding protein, partial [Clostridia bacterium]
MFKKVSWNRLKRFGKMVFKYKRYHLVAMLFMIIDALLSLALPFLTMKIIDEAMKSKDVIFLIKVILLYLAASVIQNISQILSDYVYSRIGKRIIFDLKLKILDHLSKLSGKYFTGMKTGELITVLDGDVFLVEDVATTMLFSILSEILTSIVMFVFLTRLQFDLLVITVLLQIIMLIIQLQFTKMISRRIQHIRKTLGDLSNIVQEFLSGIMHIITLNGRKKFFTQFISVGKSYVQQGIKLETTMSISMVSISLISTLVTVGILGYGGYKVIIGSMTIGGLMAFNMYSQRLLVPVIRIAQSNTKLQQGLVSIERIFTILDEPIDIEHKNTSFKPDNIFGEITFKEVYFSYKNDHRILSNINLTFEPHKTTAVVGASGSGKSTLSKLILRLWDVDEGQILLDNRDIKGYNLKFLRKNICVVSQEVFLFNDTILNNLLLESRSAKMETVIDALKKAEIYDFILSLPEQFETIVGERGVKLSGGQKQRIAIARAIITNSPIIIFDEATSSLDNISEKNVLSNLKSFFKDKTIIIIAHRLSTVRDADIIYVLNN